MNPPLFVIALAALRDFGLPLLLAVLAWFCWGLVRHLQRRTHRAEAHLDGSPLLNQPITATTEPHEVWIWNPAADTHQREPLNNAFSDPS